METKPPDIADKGRADANADGPESPQRIPASAALVPVVLQAGDYYLENSRMVFTATFHLRRGYCCRSRCRHCPYKEWSR